MEPAKNILTGISKRSKQMEQNTSKFIPFDDLYSLLCKKSILIQALGNIQKNKGSLTPGVNSETADAISLKRIDQIIEKLKNNTFSFSRVKRKWIPKLKLYKRGEKKKNRPLGIPTFSDRIVQEAIRIILESIYEPIFQIHNLNFGFRPGYGCHHCIHKIKRLGPGTTIAIEGDIEGAYDNVDHEILIKILEKRISDKKFLKFLNQSFKSGILDQGNKIDNISGVPQGGIASPILFNIYMHEFDMYIKNELKTKIDEYNKNQSRIKKPRNKKYDTLCTQINRARKDYLDYKGGRKFVEMLEIEQRELLELRNTLKNLINKRVYMPSLNTESKTIRIIYTRYADDWIIFTNCNKNFAKGIKIDIQNWLSNNLKLTLSPTKTKITNLCVDSAKFLGFSIKTYNKRRISKSENHELTKTAGWNLIIDIDANRFLDKLCLKGFCNLKRKPVAKGPWTVLNPEEIITRYNYIIRGIANYCLPVIDRLTYFQYLTYILKFSCLSTFAKKYKSKITRITAKYGDPLTINITENIYYKKLNKYKEITKQFVLLNYMTVKNMTHYQKYDWKKISKIYTPNDNVFKPMATINWRTLKNLESVCCICGTTKDVELHHIHHIRKGKVIGFSQIMNQLNRKTIPLCKTHHLEVHNHKYDDIKLSDLIGIERFLA